jgi:hypothetical protein
MEKKARENCYVADLKGEEEDDPLVELVMVVGAA